MVRRKAETFEPVTHGITYAVTAAETCSSNCNSGRCFAHGQRLSRAAKRTRGGRVPSHCDHWLSRSCARGNSRPPTRSGPSGSPNGARRSRTAGVRSDDLSARRACGLWPNWRAVVQCQPDAWGRVSFTSEIEAREINKGAQWKILAVCVTSHGRLS
jgi:hypothetical protein